MICHGCRRHNAPMPGMLCSACGGSFYTMPAAERERLVSDHLRGFPDDAPHVFPDDPSLSAAAPKSAKPTPI